MTLPDAAGPSRRRQLTSWFAALPSNMRGAIWILFASVFFTGMLTLIKIVGTHLPVSQILLIRQAIMAMIVAPVIARNFPAALVTKHPLLHMARIFLALTGMFCGFTAVVHLPLADATSISFAKSFFITIFAIIFLKEFVGVRRWVATIVGFIGVLIMLNPSGAGLGIYGIMAVAGAAAGGLVMIIVRILSREEAPVTILTYQAVFIGLIVLPLALYQWVTPTWQEWALLVAIGLFSFAGQLCNIKAFRDGEATAIASLDYVRLLWAAIIGYVVFSEVLSMRTLLGAAIIIAAALYTVRREAKRGQKLARSESGRGFTNL